jgi:hypothetical protein
MIRFHRWLAALSLASPLLAQAVPGRPAQPGQTAEPDKRVLGVLPNYRATYDTGVYTPISVQRKFVIGFRDSFDYPTVLLAGVVAGIGQLADWNPSFGQGGAGYARRFGTAYADQAIGNMMSESIFPSMLREDPRYFIRGRGGLGSRTWYAISRVFVTRTDSGGTRFNYSEWLGNAAAVGISNAYYPDGRTAGSNIGKLGSQIGLDALSQVLKEIWPDLKRKMSHSKSAANASPSH